MGNTKKKDELNVEIVDEEEKSIEDMSDEEYGEGMQSMKVQHKIAEQLDSKKRKLITEMTNDDWERLRLQKELENRNITDNNVKKLFIRSDQAYQQVFDTIIMIDTLLVNILGSKRVLDDNNVDITKGETDKTDITTGITLKLRDLEIDNINQHRKINQCLAQLWLNFSNLYRRVGTKAIDGKRDVISKKQFDDKFQFVKSELKRNGIDIFNDPY